jgi:hypothetical protein
MAKTTQTDVINNKRDSLRERAFIAFLGNINYAKHSSIDEAWEDAGYASFLVYPRETETPTKEDYKTEAETTTNMGIPVEA